MKMVSSDHNQSDLRDIKMEVNKNMEISRPTEKTE